MNNAEMPQTATRASRPRMNAIDRVAGLLVRISSLLLLLMMLHVSADVALKTLFGTPIKGTLEIVSYYYMVAAVFLPLSLIELTRNAVCVDAIYNLAPRSIRLVLGALILLASAGIYGLLAAITLPDALKAYRLGEVVMGPVPISTWQSRFILPLSCSFAALSCLWVFVKFCVSRREREMLISAVPVDEGAVG